MLIKEKLGSTVLGEKMLGQNLFDLKKNVGFKKLRVNRNVWPHKKLIKKKVGLGFKKRSEWHLKKTFCFVFGLG